MRVAFLLLAGLVGACANPIVNVQPIVTAPVLATKSAPIIAQPIVTQPIFDVQPLVQPLVKTYRTFKTISTQPVMVTQPVVKTKTFLTTQPVVKTFLTQPVLTQPIISQPIVTAPVMSTKSSALLSAPLLSGSTFSIFGAEKEALKAESTLEATSTDELAKDVSEQLNDIEQEAIEQQEAKEQLEQEQEQEQEQQEQPEVEEVSADADGDYEIMQKGGDVDIRHGGKGMQHKPGRRFGLRSCLRRCRQLRKHHGGRFDDDDDEFGGKGFGGKGKGGHGKRVKQCIRRCYRRFGHRPGKKPSKHTDQATKIVDQDVRVVA